MNFFLNDEFDAIRVLAGKELFDSIDASMNIAEACNEISILLPKKDEQKNHYSTDHRPSYGSHTNYWQAENYLN